MSWRYYDDFSDWLKRANERLFLSKKENVGKKEYKRKEKNKKEQKGGTHTKQIMKIMRKNVQ